MKVKICGITNIEDALLCYKLGADALGFIFYPKSPRYIEFDKAKEIISKLPLFIHKVGVFVNEDVELVKEKSIEIGLTAIQLHGDEDKYYINQLPLPVIKSFRVSKDFDFEKLNTFGNCSYLLDTYDKNEIGGTGKTFNWDIIPVNLRNKIILAGGISPENIKEVKQKINPMAVDLSSSLEEKPGKKDHTLVNKFFENILK